MRIMARRPTLRSWRKMGVDLKGKVVIARYGGNFRALKPNLLKQPGAAALIIYTDPEDSGSGKVTCIRMALFSMRPPFSVVSFADLGLHR